MVMEGHRCGLHKSSRNGFSHSFKWLTFLILPLPIFSQNKWHAEIRGEVAWNAPMPINIYQVGQPKLTLNAHLQTEPFTLPVYWNLRLCRGSGSRFMELELIHHKLYLTNTTAEVQKFNVSQGFNMLLANYGVTNRFFRFSLGVGLVVPIPNQEYAIGSLAIPPKIGSWGTTNLGLVRASSAEIVYQFTKLFYITLDGKVPAGFVRLPFFDRQGNLSNLTGHILDKGDS